MIKHIDKRTQKIQEALDKRFPLRLSELRGEMKMKYLDLLFWKREAEYWQQKVRELRIARATAAISVDEVSAKHIASKLGLALAEKGYHYLKHDSQFAYGLPLSVFAENPDITDDAAMNKARKVRYTMGLDGLNLAEFQDLADEDDLERALPLLAEWRREAHLARHLRALAGITSRKN